MMSTPFDNSLQSLANRWRRDDRRLFDCLEKWQAHFDAQEPEVHAFVPEERRFERLRREAEELVSKFPDPAQRPPLFGVPIGVKDIFHVDGFQTQAGSSLPPESLSGREGECISALKDAGVLILGRTISTEFAYFSPGPTRNPHNLDHTPGGSSSGSAAAVAAGLCPVALGTQTIGSISRPASYCGIVGLKASFDRIPASGVLPLSPSLDHAGIFARSVADMTIIAATLCHRWRPVKIWKKPVLGVPEGPYLAKPSRFGRAHFRSVCGRLIQAGYHIKSVNAMADFEDITRRHNRIVAAEAAQVHADLFSRFGDHYHSHMADLIKRGRDISDADVQLAVDLRLRLRQELMASMRDQQIDLWVSPSSVDAAPQGLESTGDPVMNLPWTQAGLPTLSLPCGVNASGLPMGLQLAAGWQCDEVLLASAFGIERALEA